jgi:probable pyridine nucleotide-disulfide oxidoreductase
VPYTVFTTPELGRVGPTESEARARRRVRVATLPAAAIPRAKTLHDEAGWWKAVGDADTEETLGAALLGRCLPLEARHWRRLLGHSARRPVGVGAAPG